VRAVSNKGLPYERPKTIHLCTRRAPGNRTGLKKTPLDKASRASSPGLGFATGGERNLSVVSLCLF
jgi:hypothetical protein